MPRVLLVDDDEDQLPIAREFLKVEEATFDLITTSSPSKALQKLTREHFDVAVVDHVMPGMTGLELLAALRNKGIKVPFILFTGKGREEVAIEALNLGADRYINKAGDSDSLYAELLHAINELIERQRLETISKTRGKQFQALFEQSLDPIMVLDGSLSYIDANRAALEFLECHRDEFLTKKVWDFTPPSVEGKPRQHFPFAGQETLEMEYSVHGRIKTLILNVVPLTFSGKTILYCMGQDITEKRQIAKSLRLSEDKFRFLFNYTSDPTFVYQILEGGKTGKLVEVNETLCQELGYSKTELLQMPPDAASNPIRVVELMRIGIDSEMLRNDQLSFETALIDKNGLKKPAEINAHFFPLSHGTLVLSVAHLGFY